MSDLFLTEEEVFQGCGAGRGAMCCKFILQGEQGFICGRETELKQNLIDAINYSAQRIPTEPYPLCQLKVQ